MTKQAHQPMLSDDVSCSFELSDFVITHLTECISNLEGFCDDTSGCGGDDADE